jgi:hypothetical protein
MVHLVGKVSVNVISASGVPRGKDAYVRVYATRERKMLPQKETLFTKTPAVKDMDTIVWNHKKIRNVCGEYEKFAVVLRDKGMLKDDHLGRYEFAAEELASGNMSKTLNCEHLGPAGHDRCVSVEFHYFPGDVNDDFDTTSTDPEVDGRF